jgi:hypothetical protein
VFLFFFYKQTLNLGARHSVIERKKMSYSTSSEEDERDQGPDFKLTCDGRTCCCHGNVASEKDDAYW